MIAGEGIGQLQVRGHERGHLPSDLQVRDIAVQIDPIQTLHIEQHVPIEQITDPQHLTHHHSVRPLTRPRPAPASAVRGEASLGTC
jgi:hypothetical protein